MVARLISLPVGEMSPQATEGGAVLPAHQQSLAHRIQGASHTLPPSVLPDISPTRGEISSGPGVR
jgi:hypothetical protein